jgi:transcriptional regulator with XRE-family HTH domain
MDRPRVHIPSEDGEPKIDPRLQQLGAHIRQLRVRAGASQADISRRTGLSRTSIHHLEQGDGNPTFATLLNVADALGVGVHMLIPKLPVKTEVSAG